MAQGDTDRVKHSPGPTFQELLAADTREVPVSLRDHAFVSQGSADVPRRRYTAAAFAELENEFLWTRTWQYACLQDDLPEIGSHIVYDVADQSFIIMRVTDGSVRAYHNSCLHRGTRLRDHDGRVASLRCPFHGWRWNLDGELVEVPAAWDFTHVVDGSDTCLPQARVALWNGLVFINPDPLAPDFEQYADLLVEHFERDFAFTDRYASFRAVKEIPANWKVVMEAFAEGYHVIATHPQILEFAADANSEYSIWPGSDNVTRFVNAFGEQSPHLEPLPQQQVADAYLRFAARLPAGAVEVPDGVSARAVVAEVFRSAMGERYGVDLSAISDSEMLDAHLYHLFPAFAPWAGIGQSLVYRWRPGPTADTSYMDVIRMTPLRSGQPRPAPAPVQYLGLDTSWHEAEGMGALADVFEQDMANLPQVQRGLKSAGKTGVSLGTYQEGRIRKWHRMIDDYIEAGLRASGRSTTELDPYRVPEG